MQHHDYKQHKQSNEGIPNEECPCIENEDNVRVFMKRSRSNSLTSARPKVSKMRGGGPLATGDGPAPREVACLELNSIETYDPESLRYYESDQSENSDLESLPVQLNAMSIRDQESLSSKGESFPTRILDKNHSFCDQSLSRKLP